jgi:hypothetical protein
VSQTIGYIFYSTIANNISEKYTYIHIYHYSLEKTCWVQYNISSQTKEFEQMPTSRFLYEYLIMWICSKGDINLYGKSQVSLLMLILMLESIMLLESSNDLSK